MENAQLIALSSQAALRNQLSVLSNNIANMNTNGFKSQSLRFEEYIMPVAEARLFEGAADRKLSYVHDAESIFNYDPGAIVQTDAPLDVAISGDAWFTVQTENGQRYTRDGSFTLNTLGELVTRNGDQVLSEGEPIIFSANDAEIEIAKDGTISTNQGVRGQLTVVRFKNERLLKAEGLNLYDGPDAQPALDVTFVQGALEKSNTEPVEEISKLIDVTRTYDSISRMLKKMDDLRETAIQRLGRVEA